MFTGIIFEQGVVQKMRPVAAGLILDVGVSSLPKGMKKGSSVALDGACLTLTRRKKQLLSFFVMNETRRKTHLDQRKVGDRLNMEYPLRLGDALSGHFVSGHVDTVLMVKKCVRSGKDTLLTFSLPRAYSHAVTSHGSIAINGVSLTVSRLSPGSFTVSLIPFTWQKTNLSLLGEGDRVNVEFDMLGKFVAQILKNKS